MQLTWKTGVSVFWNEMIPSPVFDSSFVRSLDRCLCPVLFLVNVGLLSGLSVGSRDERLMPHLVLIAYTRPVGGSCSRGMSSTGSSVCCSNGFYE